VQRLEDSLMMLLPKVESSGRLLSGSARNLQYCGQETCSFGASRLSILEQGRLQFWSKQAFNFGARMLANWEQEARSFWSKDACKLGARSLQFLERGDLQGCIPSRLTRQCNATPYESGV
jgi:hypothetical protein